MRPRRTRQRSPRRPQLPRVFVGSAYGKPFNFRQFRQSLNDVPFQFVYAKDHLRTRHLLENCYNLIERADFCLFDVSTWNANVTLELGLAEGLGIDYYILCKSNPTKGVPADIKGIQRIEYSTYSQFAGGTSRVLKHSLWYRVADSLALSDPLLSRLWRRLGRFKKADRLRLYSFRVLSALREQRSLPIPRVAEYSKGTRLQETDRNAALNVMEQQNLITVTSRTVRREPGLFKRP